MPPIEHVPWLQGCPLVEWQARMTVTQETRGSNPAWAFLGPASFRCDLIAYILCSSAMLLLQLEHFPHLTQLRGLRGTKAYLASAVDHTLSTEDRRDRMTATHNTSR